MSLKYKNKDEILNFIGPKYGHRFNKKHLTALNGTLLETSFGQKVYGNNIIESYGHRGDVDKVELHVYNESGDYISSDHDVQNWSLDVNKDRLKVITLDFHKDIRRLNLTDGKFKIVYNFTNLTDGKFKIVYNFTRNYISSFNDANKLFIKQISNSRRELRVALVDPEEIGAISMMRKFAKILVNNSFSTINLGDINEEQKHLELNMNFGNNNIFKIINTKMLNEFELIFRLYEPLPTDYDVDDRFWVMSELLRPYTDSIHLIPNEKPETGKYIKPANFNIEIDYWKSSETDLKNWNDLIGSNAITSQKLIDNYLSGSLGGIPINVDYSKFSEFINFSSAEERVKNFRYKLGLIEYYDQQLSSFDSYTGSLGTNKENIERFRSNTISGFDGFEKYLYYDYSSSIFSHASQSVDYDPFPKQNNEYPYILYSITSSEAISWYNDILETAIEYDRENDNSLRKTIPNHIINDDKNDSYVLYMDMLGQHYDIIWSYIKHFTDILSRDEHPKRGLSNQLLYNVAKSYGWTLTHGKQTEELWKYTFGVDGNNNMINSGSGQEQTISGNNRVHEVWKRIVNNLPYILKTKGTSRSIKALISCYGIPESVISIREYGGPRPDNFSGSINYTRYENLLEVGNGSYFTIPWQELVQTSKYPQGIEMTLKPYSSDVYQYNGSQTLFQIGDGGSTNVFVEFEATSSDSEKANIRLYVNNGSGYDTASIEDVYLYNGAYTNIAVQRNSSSNNDTDEQIYNLIAKSVKYGKIFLNESASLNVTNSTTNNSWTSNNILRVGYGNNNINSTGFSGSIYGIRYWGTELGDSQISNHTLSLRAYNSNNISSSYDDLGLRIDFNNGGIDYDATSSLLSDHPNKTITTFNDGITPLSASLINISNSNRNAQTIDYKVDGVSLGVNSIYSNKVRIESSSLDNRQLSINKRNETGAFDKNPIDSNRMDVVFSPQTIINEDIIESYGSFKIDDYIGDPRDLDKTRYLGLEKLAETYWKKYQSPNNFVNYIRVFQEYDFSIFDQIKQTLLSRTNKVLGLLIEPNILERSKVKILKSAESFNIAKEIELQKSSSIDLTSSYRSKLKVDINNNIVPDLTPSYRSKLKVDIDNNIVPELTLKKNENKLNLYINSDLLVYTDYQQYCVSIDNLQVTSLYNRTNYTKIGSNWVSQSNAKEIYSPTGSTVLNYVTNKWNKKTIKFFSSSLSESIDIPYSSSYIDSDIEARHRIPIGHQRIKFLGSSISTQDFNIDTADTPDGGPIILITNVTGNKLQTKEPDDEGNLEII